VGEAQSANEEAREAKAARGTEGAGGSMNVLTEAGGGVAKCWTDGVELEAAAEQQIRNILHLPFIHKHVAVMPDVHWGMGATVGSVIPTAGAIVPAAVGVDLGCGMIAQRTALTANDLPDSLSAMRSAIEAAVPHGRTDNGGQQDQGSWNGRGVCPTPVLFAWSQVAEHFTSLTKRHPSLAKCNSSSHLGTLGTGNHFIEVCLDESDCVWVMLHSGSRGVGNRIGSYFIERAKEHMRRWFINLPDKDLAYLPEDVQDFRDYVEAVGWAQRFAALNRELMLDATLGALATALGRPVFTPMSIRPVGDDGSAVAEDVVVNCHHNYIAREHHYSKDVWVTRKGAVRARRGDLGIIPGSMGAQSYIVRGKGNVESFTSCSHGAGRRMSRAEARRRFTVEDHATATRGVECRKDAEVIDETPGAYKDIDAVMAAQKDLVEVVHVLNQIVCVKG
jgi:tRNA-splicing ligase RtcB (3'-phosphate/5'-hydroxy nucleic acid ligase)